VPKADGGRPTALSSGNCKAPIRVRSKGQTSPGDLAENSREHSVRPEPSHVKSKDNSLNYRTVQSIERRFEREVYEGHKAAQRKIP
jgi:hypothetical protein